MAAPCALIWLILVWLICGALVALQAPPPPDPEFDEDWP